MADTPITPPTGSIAFTGDEVYFINSGDSKMFFTGYAPTIYLSVALPATGSLSFTGQTPSRWTGITFFGQDITIRYDHIQIVPTGSAAFTGITPDKVIASPPNKTILPFTGSISFAGSESALNVLKPEPGVGSLTLTGQSLDATQTTPVYPFFDILNFTGYAPTINVANSGTSITNQWSTTDVPVNYQIDDRTGFKIKVKHPMVQEYTGHMMRPESVDKRSEQEFLRAKPEHHKGPLRPEPVGDEKFVEDEYPNGVSADDL